MALKKDKQQYKIKVPNGHIPHVPAKSYVSIAFDALKPTFQRLENEADQTAQANYFQDFQIKTRDAFDQFRKDFFRNNPITVNNNQFVRAHENIYNQSILEGIKKVTPARTKFEDIVVTITPNILELPTLTPCEADVVVF